MDETGVAARLAAFLRARFPALSGRDVGSDTRLLGTGLVDSLGVLEVIAFVEQEFPVTFADEDLVPDTFETLGRLAAWVEARLAPAGARAKG
jgi:acyl carrier protein